MQKDQIISRCNCCVSGEPLTTSRNLNIVQLNVKATWNFPVWGNVLTGKQSMAVAYVHDKVIAEDGSIVGDVKFAVEFQGNQIIYHPVEKLQK